MEEKITGFKTILYMWKRIFDYKGKSGKEEYIFPLITHIILGIIAFALALAVAGLSLAGIGGALKVVLIVLGGVLTFYLLLSILPWLSLTVRRLHDTGKSGWWTVLLLVAGIGTVIVIVLCSIGASVTAFFNPSINEEPAVYGPPEIYEDYDPSFNIEPDVYGPPEMFEDYNPDDNEEVCVYGPPEMFEESEVSEEDTEE